MVTKRCSDLSGLHYELKKYFYIKKVPINLITPLLSACSLKSYIQHSLINNFLIFKSTHPYFCKQATSFVGCLISTSGASCWVAPPTARSYWSCSTYLHIKMCLSCLGLWVWLTRIQSSRKKPVW